MLGTPKRSLQPLDLSLRVGGSLPYGCHYFWTYDVFSIEDLAPEGEDPLSLHTDDMVDVMDLVGQGSGEMKILQKSKKGFLIGAAGAFSVGHLSIAATGVFSLGGYAG
ncbi:hypothetical protein BHM03_00001936 [Ensete ventricosum]|uniref:Uncharacterized protein n=1 Tax=Ensete ventricosum TaxID=4639 RepID=A0A445M9D1_ENSVE|nr:hypothetical protein BHM03_00001936 [Ensete ventricosum]